MTESHQDDTRSDGSVAEEISGRPSEADTVARAASQQEQAQKKAQRKGVTKDATAEPLLAEQDQLEVVHLHPSSKPTTTPTTAGPTGAARLALSTRLKWCIGSFCVVLLAGIVVIVVLLLLLLQGGRSASVISASSSVAGVTAAQLVVPPNPATVEPSKSSSSISKRLSFELNTSALPACQEDLAVACVDGNSWISLRGSGDLSIGPFACTSKTTSTTVCQQVVTQSAVNQLQLVLPGTYRIRGQVSLKYMPSNQQPHQQPIVLVLYAPNGTYQNDNHQVCQADKVQTLHTAATVDLTAGDTVSLKLKFPATSRPVGVKVLALRASSQMTWES